MPANVRGGDEELQAAWQDFGHPRVLTYCMRSPESRSDKIWKMLATAGVARMRDASD